MYLFKLKMLMLYYYNDSSIKISGIKVIKVVKIYINIFKIFFESLLVRKNNQNYIIIEKKEKCLVTNCLN